MSRTSIGERGRSRSASFPSPRRPRWQRWRSSSTSPQLERLQRMQKRRSLDDFSHEVRTPLAGLRSAVETFEVRGISPENRRNSGR